MPISPADFYAYSQATGAPIADTPEKRAQQAPEVLAFRQQQLQAPKQGPDLLDIIGKGALIAGAVAGGYGLARALRNRGVNQGVQKAVVQDLGTAAEQNVRRAAAYQEAPPANVATTAPSSPTGSVAAPTTPTQKPNLGVQVVSIKNVTADPWHSDVAATQIANEATLGQNPTTRLLAPARERPDPYSQLKNYVVGTGRIAPQEGDEHIDRLIEELGIDLENQRQTRVVQNIESKEKAKAQNILAEMRSQLAPSTQAMAPAETLVDQQQGITNNLIDQSINAVTSSEDQVTGRLKHTLQRNPRVDMGSVELLEETAEQNHPHGMGEDVPMQHVAEQVLGHSVQPQQELTGPQAAQRFFQQQRQQLESQGIRGLRAEKALAEPLMPGAPYVEGEEGYQQRQQKKGLTLALQTGDPNILKVFETGELPATVKLGAGASQLGEVPTSEFLAPTTLPEAAQGAQEKYQESVGKLQDKLQEIHDEINPKLEAHRYHGSQINDQIKNIDQQLLMVNHGLSTGSTKGSGELIAYRGELNAQRNNLMRQLDYHRNEIESLKYRQDRANEVYGDLIQQQQVNVPETLKSWSSELLKVTPAAAPGPQPGYISKITGQWTPITQTEEVSSHPILEKEGLVLGHVPYMRDIEAKGGGGRNVAEYVAGNRPPEIVRQMRGGGRMRDYDPITGGVQERYQPDLTQTQATTRVDYDPQTGKRVLITDIDPGLNRAIDVYGTRLSTQAASDPNLPPSKVAPSRFPLGPLKQEPTEAGRRGIDLSRTIQGIYASGRPTAHQEVQALVESLKNQQGISAVGDTSPLRTQQQNTQQTSSNLKSVYDLPMNFAYRNQAIPGTPPTTFEAIQAGLRTSTLRKPGQVPSHVQPGARITAVGPQGQRQTLEVTGRRMVTPDMAEELSKVERWTPNFLRNYISGYGGGELEQISYRMV